MSKIKVVVTKPVGCPKAIWECFVSYLPETEEWKFEDAEGTLRPQVSEFDDPSLGSGIRSEDAAHIRTAEHSRLQTTVQEAFQRALRQHGLQHAPESWQ